MGLDNKIGLRPLLHALLRLTATASALAVVPASHATNYFEASSGDLSSIASSPTNMGTLTPGDNLLVGSTVPSGDIVDPTTGQRAIEDDDYVSFTVPTGYTLAQIVLGGGSVFVPGDRMFFGIAQGSQVSVDPSFTSAKGLLGWTLIGSPAIGTDTLPALGLAAPANFPPIGGATRFTGALAAGTYTLWMVDGDRPASYSFDLVVTAVPEVTTWTMMMVGLGLTGTMLRGRTRQRREVAA